MTKKEYSLQNRSKNKYAKILPISHICVFQRVCTKRKNGRLRQQWKTCSSESSCWARFTTSCCQRWSSRDDRTWSSSVASCTAALLRGSSTSSRATRRSCSPACSSGRSRSSYRRWRVEKTWSLNGFSCAVAGFALHKLYCCLCWLLIKGFFTNLFWFPTICSVSGIVLSCSDVAVCTDGRNTLKPTPILWCSNVRCW